MRFVTENFYANAALFNGVIGLALWAILRIPLFILPLALAILFGVLGIKRSGMMRGEGGDRSLIALILGVLGMLSIWVVLLGMSYFTK